MSMTPKGYFVTGTDTAVGKTLAALGLMQGLKNRGLRVAGMKPVACGGVYKDAALCNEDALALQQAGNVPLRYQQVNPLLFAPAIAPHIAAKEANRRIGIGKLVESFQNLAAQVDRVVVEGAGGWLVPLNDRENMADLARGLDLPIILVVGLRLGCLNHTLLTVKSVENYGLRLAGWVANLIDPGFQRVDDNITALQERVPAPLLARIPWFEAVHPPPEEVASHFQARDLDQL